MKDASSNASAKRAAGEAARQLYALLLAEGKSALASGDIPAATVAYRKAAALDIGDTSEAQQGLGLALSATPTPPPTSTATATRAVPTSVPTPHAVVLAGPLTMRSSAS